VRDLGRTSDGPNLRKFLQQFDAEDGTWLGLVLRDVESGKGDVDEFREEMTEGICDALVERFEEVDPLYRDMLVIDTSAWPLEAMQRKKGGVVGGESNDEGDEEGGEVASFLASFGVEELRRLTGHYSEFLLNKRAEGSDDPFDAASLELCVLQDWECFKADLARGDIGIEKVKSCTHSEFWGFMRNHYQERYPWLLWIVLIIRLVPIGSAECERMFSLMNRLKTDLRNRMKNSTLNDLMTVNRLAPETLSEDELDELIEFWEAECKTGRYTSYFK